MPPRKKPKTAPPVTVNVADRIGALPDSMLKHVLSFLPVQTAVHTCMLARRWRHLWRSATDLRINYHYDDNNGFVQDLRKFVDHLLILRERTNLGTVKIKIGEYSEDDVPYVNLWIRYAVMCKVRRLTLGVTKYLDLDDLPLVSRHLRKLDLDGVRLRGTFLDFANCPALEDLKMTECDINVDRMSSRSLKHLSISFCGSDLDYRFHVSTPGLVYFELDFFMGRRTPLLENMALLETANVDLSTDCEDVCLSYDSGVFCGANSNACQNCVPIEDDYISYCVLLDGISSAKHLKLLSQARNFLFIRDLKHCPTFSNLKTLLLNEYWCEAPDFDPLACILKNSPALEKLTLQLFSRGPKHEVEMKGSYSPMEGPSAISEHFNIVEVKCNVVDKRIMKVLKFLSAFNIRFSFD